MSFARWDTKLQHVWVALSYRPLDTSLAVWRASARLADAFGRERIFFDGYARQDCAQCDSDAEAGVLFRGGRAVRGAVHWRGVERDWRCSIQRMRPDGRRKRR